MLLCRLAQFSSVQCLSTPSPPAALDTSTALYRSRDLWLRDHAEVDGKGVQQHDKQQVPKIGPTLRLEPRQRALPEVPREAGQQIDDGLIKNAPYVDE